MSHAGRLWWAPVGMVGRMEPIDSTRASPRSSTTSPAASCRGRGWPLIGRCGCHFKPLNPSTTWCWVGSRWPPSKFVGGHTTKRPARRLAARQSSTGAGGDQDETPRRLGCSSPGAKIDTSRRRAARPPSKAKSPGCWAWGSSGAQDWVVEAAAAGNGRPSTRLPQSVWTRAENTSADVGVGLFRFRARSAPTLHSRQPILQRAQQNWAIRGPK